LSFHDEREGQRRRKSDNRPTAAETSRPRGKRPPSGDVGSALRSAYERTLREDIPPEMLDLLGKLG